MDTRIAVSPRRVQEYLYRQIPLSKTMGVQIEALTPEEVRLSAPLAPNINHQETVFGGSASALAILAGWTWLDQRLRMSGDPHRIVIQRNEMRYLKPIRGEYRAVSATPEPAIWDRFLEALHRHGRARIRLAVELESRGERVAEFEGDYVALQDDSRRMQ